MAEPIILDTNILTDISRGNKAVADALTRYLKSGTPVYISQAAYDELVVRSKTPEMGGQYREMLNDLGIQKAPPGLMADRVNFYADNIQRTPAPGQPGQIREYDRRDDPTKPGDVFVAAQAKATDAKLWTLDDKLARRARSLGVKLAPECDIPGMSAPENPVKGRELLGLNPKPIGPGGQVLPATKAGGIPGSYSVANAGSKAGTNATKPGGSGGSGGTMAHVGVPDNFLPEPGGPSARGQAIVGGIQLAFEGVNFVLNIINDNVQRQKVTEALYRVRPELLRVRTQNPRLGILLLFYYTQFQAPEDSLIKPGAVFNYVTWGKGVTRDEALLDAFSTPSISAGPGGNERKFSQEVWIPPLLKTVVTTAKCPFPPIAVGQFYLGNSHRAQFQLVDFTVFGGFDDVVEKSIELPKGTNAEFAVLKPPAEVRWFNAYGRQMVNVPLKTARTANGNDITVVNLDPYSPFSAAAAMCFPVDDWTEKVFDEVEETRGCRLLSHTNFSMIRWIRAEHIHLLRFL